MICPDGRSTLALATSHALAMIELEKLVASAGNPPQNLVAGSTVYSSGDRFEGVFFVCVKHVKIIKKVGSQNIFLWMATKGDLIGLDSYFSQSKRYTHTAQVGDADCQVIFIQQEKFSEMLEASPELNKILIKILINRVQFAEFRTNSMLNKSIRKRLAKVMLFLCCNSGTGKMTRDLLYSPRELAQIVGTTTRYAKRILAEFNENGLIEYRYNCLTIRDLDRLRMI